MTHSPAVLRPARPLSLLTRMIIIGFLATVVGTGLALSTSVPANGLAVKSFSTTAISTTAYERRVRHWVNVERAKHGLRPVRRQWCTNRMAERWTRHLTAMDHFHHRSMRTVLNRCNASYAGETLARGSISPWRTVRLWMRSPGHRAVILSPKARRIGIGARPDAHGRWVTTANFTRF